MQNHVTVLPKDSVTASVNGLAVQEPPPDIPLPREAPKSSLRADEGEVQAELKRIEASMSSTNGALISFDDERRLYGKSVQKRLRDVESTESLRRKVGQMPRSS